MERKLSPAAERRAMHNNMWKVKVHVICDTSSAYGLNIRKKRYFNDQGAAEECMVKYQALLNDAMRGAEPTVTVEGLSIKSDTIVAYSVKLRGPKPAKADNNN